MASVANALDFGPGLLGYGRPLAAPAQVTSRGRSARVMSEVTSLASSLPVSMQPEPDYPRKQPQEHSVTPWCGTG
jgi:hypothetical protein